jgi:hypothetical protein
VTRPRFVEVLIWILTAFFVVMMFAAPVRDLRVRLATPLATSPP